MKWANFILKWASGFWMGEWHNCGRMKFSLAHKWANFWKFAQVTAIFTYVWANFSHMGGRIFRVDFGWAIFSHLKNSGRFFTRRWANFSHMGGRIFRVNFGWAIFSHLKNSGRFFHTSVGEFLTRGWANFQGQFWVGEFFTSQKQWAIFTHFVKEDPHLRQILDKEALASLLI